MKTTDFNRRLKKDRPMTSITIRMPEDVVEDLKRAAPVLGFSGYQPLIRYYIGQNLRKDLENLENSKLDQVIVRLKDRGVSAELINEVIHEVVNE